MLTSLRPVESILPSSSLPDIYITKGSSLTFLSDSLNSTVLLSSIVPTILIELRNSSYSSSNDDNVLSLISIA